MTILLVDDEYYLIQGVRHTVDWEKLGIDTVLVAYSAEQARKVMAEQPADILLTDVEMPREDGLSLIRSLQASGYDPVPILLTGHSNFNYAKEAISLQVLDYLLKPIEIQQLENVLGRAVEKVRSERQREDLLESSNLQSFWQTLYRGDLADDGTIRRVIAERGLPDQLSDKTYFYSYLVIQGNDPASLPAAGEAVQLLKDTLTMTCHVTQLDSGEDLPQLTFMLATELPEEDVEHRGELERDKTNALIRRLTEARPDLLFIIYSCGDAPLHAAPYACEMLRAYARRYSSAESRAIFILEPIRDIAEWEESARDMGEGLPDLPISRWEDLLYRGRVDDILRELSHMVGDGSRIYSLRFLAAIYYALLNLCFSTLSSREISFSKLTERMSSLEVGVGATRTPAQLVQWARESLTEVYGHITESTVDNSTIGLCRQYIKEHLSDPDLDRSSIAEAVHMSPDYLSSQFHKETGKTLSSYINDERMALAGRLLITTDLSSQEVAERVGFANPSYFHKQFKKATGLTPAAFRNK